MLRINVVNSYDNLKTYKPIIQAALNEAYRHMSLKGRKVISVVLIDNDSIHAMNKQYRHKDYATDVLSFENTDEGDELGDIIISIDKAKEQALQYGHSFERELAFLSVHGFLHCLGYDHETKEEEDIMTSLQEVILKQVGFVR